MTDNDGRGLYRKLPLHAAGLRSGESGIPWGGYDPGERLQSLADSYTGIMSIYIREHNLIPGLAGTLTPVSMPAYESS